MVINDDQFIDRAEILWEKGTNRAEFFRGNINKYGWVDTGSSFLPSDIIAAFLWAQLENIEDIQDKRLAHWHFYYEKLQELSIQYCCVCKFFAFCFVFWVVTGDLAAARCPLFRRWSFFAIGWPKQRKRFSVLTRLRRQPHSCRLQKNSGIRNWTAPTLLSLGLRPAGVAA